MIIPTQPVPLLDFPIINGEHWDITDRSPKAFSLIVVYRGLHCPICKSYTQELKQMQGEFAKRGVEVVAVSADTKDRAERTNSEWELDGMALGYGLDIAQARHWGMFISRSIGDRGGIIEPSEFVEPGLFLVTPTRDLFFASIQTMPFARPPLKDVLRAIDYVQKNDYPARGNAV